MRHVILAVTVFAFMGPARAVAQDVLWFEPGAKVRVTAPTLGLDGHTGVIQELTGDSLFLATETNGPLQVHRIPMSAIAKLDVRTGRRSHWVKGAGIGALVGLIRGVSVARSDGNPDDDPLEIGVGAGHRGPPGYRHRVAHQERPMDGSPTWSGPAAAHRRAGWGRAWRFLEVLRRKTGRTDGGWAAGWLRAALSIPVLHVTKVSGFSRAMPRCQERRTALLPIPYFRLPRPAVSSRVAYSAQ